MKIALHRQLLADNYLALGEAAQYIDASGVAQSARMIYEEAGAQLFGPGASNVRDAAISFRVRVSEWAQPTEKDVIVYEGDNYIADQAPERISRLEWRVYVRF